MYTILFQHNNTKKFLPADLSECDKYQYIDMCGLIFDYQCQKITFDDFRYHAVYRLLDLKPTKAPFGIGNEDKYGKVVEYAEYINDFFEDNEAGQKVIRQEYIHNPVPSFRPAWKTYYGPADSFLNMTFGEYREAVRLFNDFDATQDVELLYLIAALFYRPKKRFHFIHKHRANYNGDIRQPLNSHTLENRAKAFRYAPIGFVYGVYLLFASFQKYIVTAQILWSGKELDLSILFDVKTNQADTSSALPGIGMDSIAFAMAESGTFGTLTEVDKTNFWQIMVRMYEMRRNDLERQKQEKNAAS